MRLTDSLSTENLIWLSPGQNGQGKTDPRQIERLREFLLYNRELGGFYSIIVKVGIE
jgi:hypothetical protein